VQTLNLLPYRVDLTPFAGTLSNGQQHTVGVTVFNAFNYFSTTAALLIYEDHGSKHVTGEVTENNLTAPDPTVVNNTTFDSSGNGGGTVTVTSSQSYTIAGYVNTSHGRVNTKVEANVNFSNAQTLTSTANTFGQDIVQTSTVNQKTTTQDGLVFTGNQTNVSYPFTLNYLETLETNGDIGQVSTVDQKYQRSETDTLEGFPIFESNVSNEVTSGDTATFVPTPTGYGLGPNSGQSSRQTYVYKDSLGTCYSRELKAANNVLDTITDGAACHQR
jgi:Peptide N-acetyl-beta-D-glucosaminyl asparaginase amidase A